MKTQLYFRLLTTMFAFCLSTVMAYGQFPQIQNDYTFTKHRLSTDLAPLLWGSQVFTSEYNLGYEYRWTPRQQSGLRLAYIGFNAFLNESDTDPDDRRRDLVRANGFAVGVFHKFFLTQKPKANLYLAPDVAYYYTYYADQKSTDDLTLRKLRNSLRFGFEQVILQRLTIDLSIGLAVNMKNYAWEAQGSPEQPATPPDDDLIFDGNWSTGWGLVERPAVGLGIPISFRLGYQF